MSCHDACPSRDSEPGAPHIYREGACVFCGASQVQLPHARSVADSDALWLACKAIFCVCEVARAITDPRFTDEDNFRYAHDCAEAYEVYAQRAVALSSNS